MSQQIKYILTDIEGTTTSISFVYDVLFPYFRENIQLILEMESEEVNTAIEETKKLALELENCSLNSKEEVINQLLKWSIEDKKITPLKTIQGILWKNGYETNVLKGHVYEDVPLMLKKWETQGIKLGVFSSGSVAAQKLIFSFSVHGDLSTYFSNYFDTTTGTKRDPETYLKIAKSINIDPNEILFLSDIKEELEAAEIANFQTIQLVRKGTLVSWKNIARTFNEIVTN